MKIQPRFAQKEVLMQFVPITERRPVQIGGVPLSYIHGPYFPTLREMRICLPVSPDAKLAKLHGDTQFLYFIDAAQKYLFWGGMDEQSAFLNRVSLEVLPHLTQGEEVFYKEVKPPVIRFLESLYGARWTRRQGDVSVIPLQKSWKDVLESGKMMPRYHYGRRVLRTRHRHYGFYIRDYLGAHVNLGNRGNIPSQFDSALTLIASGSLRAPNHAPLNFRGPHVVARSAHLLDID